MNDLFKDIKIKTYSDTDEIKGLLNEIQDFLLNNFPNPPVLYSEFLFITGIMNRTYELTDTAIWSLNNKRPITGAMSMRGLYETLAYTMFWCEKIFLIPKVERRKEMYKVLISGRKPEDEFQSVNILTCLNKVDKYFSNLSDNYASVSEIVHPNATSHFYCGEAVEDKKMVAKYSIPYYNFKNRDDIKLTNQVGECCQLIIEVSKVILTLGY